jgi:hypothetical protein
VEQVLLLVLSVFQEEIQYFQQSHHQVVVEELLVVEHLQEQLVDQEDLVEVVVELTVEQEIHRQLVHRKVIQEEQDFQIHRWSRWRRWSF